MKKVKILLIVLILIIGGIIFTRSYAENTTRHIWATLDRPFTPIRYVYYIKSNGDSGVNPVVVKLSNGLHDIRPTNKEIQDSSAIYCLRGGAGFGNIDETNNPTEHCYNETGEMHTQARVVIDKYKDLYKDLYPDYDASKVNLDRDITINLGTSRNQDPNHASNNATINVYNAILWILDEAYLPNDITENDYYESDYREELLDKAGIYTDRDKIGKDEIETVQQLALWYFANYDEQENGKRPTVSQKTMFPADKLSVWENGSLNNNISYSRALNKLYQYFVYGAIDSELNDVYVGGDTRTRANQGAVVFDKENSNINNTEANPYIVHTPTTMGFAPGPITEYYTIIGPFALKNENGNGVSTVNATDIVLYETDSNDSTKLIPINKYFTVQDEYEQYGKFEVYEFFEEGRLDTVNGKKELNGVGNKVLETGKSYYIKYYNMFKKGFDVDIDLLDAVPEDEKHNLEPLDLKISSTYTIATATFLEPQETAGEHGQAVVELSKKKIKNEDWLKFEPKELDLALRKFISNITRGTENIIIDSREPRVALSTLISGVNTWKHTTERTATYTHSGTPITVKNGDIVEYTIRIYNEGEKDGRASEVTDHLPEGLKLATNSSTNSKYRWTNPSGDGKTITTDYLKYKNIVIPAFKTGTRYSIDNDVVWKKATDSDSGLYYTDLKVECIVDTQVGNSDKSLINFAEITGYEDGEGKTVVDRDSNPSNININEYDTTTNNEGNKTNSTYQDDDDDYEPLVVKKGRFDLALRKFIVKAGDTEYKNENSREPQYDTSTLINGRDGEFTATYNHPKNKVTIATGDKVVYTIRIYNEGDLDGTATEIRDYLPEGLEFVPTSESEINRENRWEIVSQENGKTVVKTSKLADTNIAAFEGGNSLHYADVQIECKVVATIGQNDKSLRNIAEIAEDNGNDDDSTPNNVDTNNYTPPTDNSTYQQDDDDYEDLVLPTKKFDLALRKYITKVERNGQNVTIPNARNLNNIDTSKLNTTDSDTTAEYKHRKDPVEVMPGDVVTYTFKVYNEADIKGYVTSITDYLPAGLEFKDSLNTSDLYKFTVQGNKLIIEAKTGNLFEVESYNGTTLDSKSIDVKLRVSAEYAQEDQILTNIATMSYGPIGADVIDRDSSEEEFTLPGNLEDNNLPGYHGEDNKDDLTDSEYHYKGQQDDDDFEKIIIKAKSFDLSLRKFISKVERTNKNTNQVEELDFASRVPEIYISDLKSGSKKTARYVHPKKKLSLKRGDIITYTIRVYNEGDLDGYAKIVKDYIPEGLELVEGRNSDWTASGNELTSTALQNKLLKAYNPDIRNGDQLSWQQAIDDESGLYYYDLKVVCKIKDNVTDGATLVNIAEIENDLSVPKDLDDRDSTPGNFPDSDKNNDYDGNGEDNGYYPGKEDDDDFEPITIEPTEVFDLSLRKYITRVGTTDVPTRVPSINANGLNNGETTAEYKHRKDPVEVNTGDLVTYKLTIYNEGEAQGRATKVIDQLPKGLKFVRVVSGNYELDNYDETANKVSLKEKRENQNLAPFNKDTKALDSTTIELECMVTENGGSKDAVLTNIAWISEAYDANRNIIITSEVGKDRDSEPRTAPDNNSQNDLRTIEEIGFTGKDTHPESELPNNEYFEGFQDDDDFEKLIIKGKPFDLALRKFIAKINEEELKGDKSREPKIDLTTLDNGTYNRDGKTEYTATYEPSKEPLIVKKGDVITYTLRIYNEGARSGYATEITDYIPEGLALIQNHETNFNNGWSLDNSEIDNSQIINLVGENGFYKSEENVRNLKIEDFEGITSLKDVQLVKGKVKITTNALDDELIKAYGADKENGDKFQVENKAGSTKGLFYQDVQVTCLVIAENTFKGVLTNEAEISEDKDENKQDVEDRDSTPDNVTDRHEDDDDYEPVILRYFDLALRKFITNVESLGKSKDVTSRIPELSIDDEGNIKYEHSKDPVYVANNDIVTYTIRVYNEGTIAGYAEEITDDLPDGLLFLPENETNKKYGWVMLDKDGNVTDDVLKADKIVTDYLSSAKEQTTGRDNLIDPFDSSLEISDTNPDYRDVQIAFQVIEENTSERVLVNSAQISEDSDDDEDSIPNEWNENEDDQDQEFVRVRYFDLSLLKWVTQSIVTVDGKTTTKETGFQPNQGLTETTGIRDNNTAEPIAKVELDRKKLSKTTVKFVYKIRVTNEGELEGYATEITDFIPEGLEFYEEDNKAFGWKKEGDTKVTTRALETTLLKPGESAELTIVFRWKNNASNLGLKTNIAEITEDYNEYDSNDIDSIPNDIVKPYEKEQEDDDDYALVILSIKTGKEATYTLFIISMIALLATGIYLVKRYVLDY